MSTDPTPCSLEAHPSVKAIWPCIPTKVLHSTKFWLKSFLSTFKIYRFLAFVIVKDSAVILIIGLFFRRSVPFSETVFYDCCLWSSAASLKWRFLFTYPASGIVPPWSVNSHVSQLWKMCSHYLFKYCLS